MGAKPLRIALAQINTTVGAIGANTELIVQRIDVARQAGAGLVLFPELTVSGYPPEDLLFKKEFIDACEVALIEISGACDGIAAVVGYPRREGGLIFNSAAVLQGGRMVTVYDKYNLPNYGVFDEQRYFRPGSKATAVDIGGVKTAVTICEDLWVEGEPLSEQIGDGVELVVNLSASPYQQGKGAIREELFSERAKAHSLPIACCNLVGGQDELVFDGHSFMIGPGGEPLARCPQFESDLLVYELGSAEHQLAHLMNHEEEVFAALVTGTRDYVKKSGFAHVAVGLSGGIDSALVAAVATESFGPDRVTAVVMPSPYSSAETQEDARQLAKNLGIECLDLSIEPIMRSYTETLRDRFEGTEPGEAEENIQARIRGNLLMALSNKFGWLVLSTGNKSEYSVGYATLYGDMAGGFAVLKDVPKTLVFDLVRYYNESRNKAIPESIIGRKPSAELRPGQVDEDSLPPYGILDPILKEYIENDLSLEQIVAMDFDRKTVEKVIRLVDRAEYKRRQAPPGVKIRPKAFGRDRRMPIVNRFKI